MLLNSNQAFTLLTEKVTDKMTGEIIVAAVDLEAHIYLQEGRIAWAYSNLERGAFLRELMNITGLDEDSFRDVLQECRTQRKHVAETLLEWKLATERDVRRALWSQIGTTLQTIAEATEPNALFLRRSTSNYDTRLTFSINEFERDTFSSIPATEVSDPELRVLEASLRQSVLETVPAALWVRLVHPPRSTTLNMLGIVTELLLSVGVTECAYRGTNGWLFALRHPEGFLFCGLRPEAPISKVRKQLYVQMAQPVPDPSPALLLSEPYGTDTPPALAALRPTFEHFEFIAGIYHITPDETSFLLRKGAPHHLGSKIEQSNALLGLPLAQQILSPDAPQPTSELTPSTPGIRLELPEIHLLGTPLGNGTSLWLALCPSVLEGFGWGLLANALRTLSS